MSFQKQKRFLFLLLFLFISTSLFAQKFGFRGVLDTTPDIKMPFAIPNNSRNLQILKNENIPIKESTERWIYITNTPSWIKKHIQNKTISDFYFEYAPPTLLDDTARKVHDVNQVHHGLSPLHEKYTGKGVIIGLVDAGLDHNHPDFIDSNGQKRVIRYWDQSITNPTQSPQPYGYGQIWYKEQIQNGTITSNEESVGHGTSVTGICAGNGRADGRNKGMAPEAKIIFVETNFNLPNWTLTVADACDYIFRVADSLNMPAVINLSVGSYLGSHDGEDPAGQLMTQLVEEKNGRIIVGAAGNGGDLGNYHAQCVMNGTDTNFIWFKPNPGSQLNKNSVFFDLWADANDAQFYYSFGANDPNNGYKDVASTAFRFAQLNVGTVIYDTLRNTNGDPIATLEVYTEYMGDNFHLQGYFSHVDSTDYYMRFSTKGQGTYDLWTGEWMGLNKIVESLPSPAQYPPIVNYVSPDNQQTLVSSWNCSPKIVAVANAKCRLRYLNHEGNYFYPSDNVPPGKIMPSSSHGPTRNGLLKPEITADGDLTLGSAPLFMVGNPAYAKKLGELGWHLRNGGTSMASPIVAGIAALYLERCPNSSAEDFIADLEATATQDQYTGTVPNNTYGYGKVNAFNLLVSKNRNLQLLGDTIICQVPVELTSNIQLMRYHWSDGSTNSNIFVAQPDSIYLIGRDLQGCKVFSDTVIIQQGSLLPHPAITQSGDTLLSNSQPNYQWYRNDIPIPGATNSSYIPTTYGYYSVAVQGVNSCKSFSNVIHWTLGINKEEVKEVKIYPNPANSQLHIQSPRQLESVAIYTTSGKKVLNETWSNKKGVINIQQLAKGAYLLKLRTAAGIKVYSFFKQ